MRTIVKNIHPHLDETYFEEINTLEKAYWLGFLYADGFITATGGVLRLQLSVRDEILIDRLSSAVQGEIGLKKYYGGDGKYTRRVEWAIANPRFVSHLINKGCIYKKTGNISFPDMASSDFEKAFLLGYYDGDGDLKGSLACGCRSFLEQVKQIFGLKSRISEWTNPYGKCYSITIDRPVLFSLFDTYNDSLERKRFRTHRKGPRLKQRKTVWPSREELETLLWQIPSETIAAQYGVSGGMVGKWAASYRLSKPPRGYWTKRNNRRCADTVAARSL